MSRLPAAEQAAVPVLPAMLTPLRESAEALPDGGKLLIDVDLILKAHIFALRRRRTYTPRSSVASTT